jgi:arsenite methyltransferase
MPTPEEVKQTVTATFDTVASGYDNPSTRFFPDAADRLIALLRPRPGQKILDVAAGTGVVTVAAAQAVGTSGRVTAVDLSEAMLQRAEQTVRKLGLAQVDFHAMDAEDLGFQRDHFDHALSSFGLFFLPDMARGLGEWMRVTRPGGTVAFTSFGPKAFQPMSKLFLDRIAGFGVPVPADRSQMGWFRLSTDAKGLALMTEAGLVDKRVERAQLGYHLQSPEDWWELCWNAGYRSFLMQLSDADVERFRQEHLEEVAALAGDQGIWLDVEVLFFLGRKPDAGA